IHKSDPNGADSDLGIPIFVNQQALILRDRFDLVEGLSGWDHDDILVGRQVITGAAGVGGGLAAIPDPNSSLDSFTNLLQQSSVDRIAGFDQLVSHLERVTFAWNGEQHTVVVMDEATVVRDGAGNVTFVNDSPSDILLGGGGSDTFNGKAGNDIIDGDAWLNVRISVLTAVPSALNPNPAEWFTVDSLDQLTARMLTGEINPGQLQMVREILHAPAVSGIDVAVFNDVSANYLVVQNIDGSLTIEHFGGNQADGIDTVRNIEQVQFIDGTLEIDRAASGQPLIQAALLREGAVVSLDLSQIADPDVIDPTSFLFQWQVGDGVLFEDIIGANDATLTLTQSQVGQQLRAIVLFLDQRGFSSLLASDPSAVVGDIWIGDALANVLTGTAGSDLLQGLDGNDSLFGFGGNDELVGDAGQDLLDGGSGNDAMAGGAGNDTYVADSQLDQVTELAGQGSDMVRTALLNYALQANVENLQFLGTGNFSGTGNTTSNTIWGGDGNDTLSGGASGDRLLGGAGDDWLDGGTNADTMIGGAGNDTYLVDAGGDTVQEAAGQGNDTVLTTRDSYTL
ncbi:MAG: calcium-binding protein, partial [Lacisediminimonas sp.]|nr:calcium-binding protein [Lacisediminimonas sp.]